MIDYSIFYRRTLKADRVALELAEVDIFVSAFNSSERVRKIFDDVNAKKKIWFIQPEYQYTPLDYPEGHVVVSPNELDEVLQVNTIIDALGDLTGKTLCIDITGFMRNTLCFLVAKLAHIKVEKFTALYSEPMFYKKQENTTFTTTTSGFVRPVRGMAGVNNSNGKDYLIISVGYDNKLINEVINYKDNSVAYPLFAFPSLSPDMFQQSAICSARSGDIALSSDWITNRRFAPANDPFSTAKTISSIVKEIDRANPQTNIYLSPLSTKVQTLGLALYWHLEGKLRGAVSVILPECVSYARETSEGIKRVCAFEIEL